MNDQQREEAATRALEEIHASGRQWAYAHVIGERVMAEDDDFMHRYRLKRGVLSFLLGVKRPEVPDSSSYVRKLRVPLRHLEEQGIVESKKEELPRVPGVKPRLMFRLVQ